MRRRQLTGFLVGIAAAGAVPILPAAAQDAAAATGMLQRVGQQIVEVVNTASGPDDKRIRLRPLLENNIDVDGIARFCLGRFWRQATADQQRDYVELFHAYLLNTIVSRLGELRGIAFATTTTTQRDGDYLVGTIINRPNQRPANVQWVVAPVAGQPKVIDVVAEGTSLRLTQRSDYAAYIQRNGGNVDALIAAMRQQTQAH
jgi:phospholipid transport system substrate-binding protein